MAFWFCLWVSFLLSMKSTVQCSGVPKGSLHMECRDRYFMIAVDLSFTGTETYFEAVDGMGVYAITKQYAAQCGYSISLLPLQGRLELRASYFSCHADNKDDEVFLFNFNLIVTRDGKEDSYPLNKTCSPSLPWSPREITCEENYMEISLRSEIACSPRTIKDDWKSLKTAHDSTTSDWQVMFQRNKHQLPPMNLSTARKQGYAFAVTDGRLVFRTAYGRLDSFSTEVDGVPVEAVHVTLFSRQGWIVIMVDLVATCSMHEGSYDYSGYVMWKTPEAPYRSLYGTQVNIGLNGELVAQPVAEERGFIVKNTTTVQISFPYNVDGGYRKSFVTGDLYEFYVFHLYLEQILVDEDHVETRVRFQRTLSTPLLARPLFTKNQTVLAERAFTVYLGDVPDDLQLAAVYLNGQEFPLPFTNATSHTIAEVVHPNNTLGYTLKVSFDDPVVHQKFFQDAVLQYRLDINFTLTVLPENECLYQLACIEAFTDVFPVFKAVCLESGISFKLDHWPFDYSWEISIGQDLLTPELAVQRGYYMSNDGQSLLLEVPLFSPGYTYQDVTLKGFFGTFEILVRRRESSEVQSSTIKTCPFSPTELIMCSTNGTMTVVGDFSLAIPRGGVPARLNLVDEACEPKETDGTRALFSFPLYSCGSTVKLNKENVTYQNAIFYSGKTSLSNVESDATEEVIMQCTYPLAGLHRLFSVFRFESDSPGVGSIIHATQPAEGLQSPTTKPTAAPKATPASQPVPFMPASHPTARYIKVQRGAQEFSKTKGNRALI